MYNKKVIKHFLNPKFFGKIKNADAVAKVGNPRCVPLDTLIFSNPNVKTISNIKIGEKVIGHDGRFHCVRNIFKRNYLGKLLRITVHNLGTSYLTPEHPVYCLKTNRVLRKFKEYKNYSSVWCRADQLEKGDIILYPILQVKKDIRFIPFDVDKPKWDFKSKNLPEKIKIDNDFLRLVGYYLSEGYVRTDPCKGTLGFAFREDEKEYVSDTVNLVKKIFKINPTKLYVRNRCIKVDFYSARLARFFKKEFGKGALNKHLPGWAITLPPEEQAYILCGLWRGDGYITPKRAKFVTISETLARQIELLLLRQRIVFSFAFGRAYGIHQASYQIYIQDDDSLKKIIKITGDETKVTESINKKNNPHSWYDRNYYYTTIEKITIEQFKGIVYNLEVAKSQSFLTNSLALHNCGDIMDLYIKVEKKKGKEVIKDIKFHTLGCAAAIASSDMICEKAKGKTLDEALKIKFKDILKDLGELPPLKVHCSVLATSALKKAIENYQKNIK